MRDRLAVSILLILFLVIAAGLFYSQILRHGYYSDLSRNNSIRIVPIEGPRGNIFDRNGEPLVTNRLSFDVALIYQEITDRARLAGVLSETLGMSGAETGRAIEKASRRPYASVTIAEDIPKEKAIALEEAAFDLSGIDIETRARRDYPYKHFGSHIFGYLSEVTEDELETLREYGYRMRDLVGRDGIEKQCESFLRGVDGGIQVEVDNRGRRTKILGIREPESGQDVYLTVDISLQRACDKLLGDHKGAVIVMDPISGEVLALASHPAYDPNIFINRSESRKRLELLNDKVGRPMSNKAISSSYPPGSVFKIVTAAAALDQRKITRNTRFFCPGAYKLGNTSFNCWKDKGHESQNVVEGMKNSCNVFFYNVGRALGVDRLEAYARLFGFGRPTGIDLPDEVSGILPGKDWKRTRGKGEWYQGETLNYAIGQGYLLATPIQALRMAAVMANNGNLVQPRIVRRAGSKDIRAPKLRNIGLKNETVREVRSGLFEAVNGENGTAKRSKLEKVMVAGKTGTAQNPQGRTHAWFCGFAPFDNPRICLVVFLEHGGKGGVEPAIIARGIFEEANRLGYI